MKRSASDIICFTYVSADDFWQETAQGLKHNLAQHGFELIIHTENNDPAETFLGRYQHYSRKDASFVDFARQETRRSWLLDAEVRLVRPVPQYWLDSEQSVLFYTDRPSLRGYPAINTGQSIWAPDMVPFYAESIELAIDLTTNDAGILYDVEDVLPTLDLPPHIKALISCDRRTADPAATASKGSWINANTCIIHPHQHTFQQEYNQVDVTWNHIPKLKQRDFLNHFSPFDLDLAQHVFDVVLRRDDSTETWFTLDLEGFEDTSLSTLLNKIMPEKLGFLSRYGHARCYALQDWIFCPAFSLAAPQQDWPVCAYQLVIWPAI